MEWLIPDKSIFYIWINMYNVHIYDFFVFTYLFHFPKSKSHISMINLCQSHENPITTGNSSQFPQFLCQLCNLSRLFTQKLFTYCFYFLLRKIETSGMSWICVGNCDNFNLPHISVRLSKLDLFIR